MKYEDRRRLQNQIVASEVDENESDEAPEQSDPKNPEIIISKRFESQESSLRSNVNMHPIHIKSKIPNPKLIRPQTVPVKTKIDASVSYNCVSTHSQLDSDERETENGSEYDLRRAAFDASRCKSALPPKLISMRRDTLFQQRPRTAHRFKIDLNREPSIDSKFAAIDNLNLKTHIQVEKIVDAINGCLKVSPDANKEKEKADIYKTFWSLKSTGQYHGSLLAKPRVIAPEIRE